ncbi:MAG: TylF/MycF/NovP-related O-methyltransferase [Promethearchaeota archaeon]
MINKLIKKVLNKFGYTVIKTNLYNSHFKKKIAYDMDVNFKEIYEKTEQFTMTSVERMYAMYKATEYVVNNKIPGDIVECGVWKGGSMMISALTLLKMNEAEKILYLYDTYEGMSMPTEKDLRAFDNKDAISIWKKTQKGDARKWLEISLEEVKKNLYSTNFPTENIRFIKGKVEHTIPNIIPEKISLLRLDTDLFESTYHEITHLYPKLSLNGIIIIDDYGYWKGQKEAIDKYFKENNIKILLNRIDDKGRIGIKTKS